MSSQTPTTNFDVSLINACQYYDFSAPDETFSDSIFQRTIVGKDFEANGGCADLLEKNSDVVLTEISNSKTLTPRTPHVNRQRGCGALPLDGAALMSTIIKNGMTHPHSTSMADESEVSTSGQLEHLATANSRTVVTIPLAVRDDQDKSQGSNSAQLNSALVTTVNTIGKENNRVNKENVCSSLLDPNIISVASDEMSKSGREVLFNSAPCASKVEGSRAEKPPTHTRIADKSTTPTTKNYRSIYSNRTSSQTSRKLPLADSKLSKAKHSPMCNVATKPPPRPTSSKPPPASSSVNIRTARCSLSKSSVANPMRPRTSSTGSDGKAGAQFNLDRLLVATKSSSLKARTSSVENLPQSKLQTKSSVSLRHHRSSTGSTGPIKKTSVSGVLHHRTSSDGTHGVSGTSHINPRTSLSAGRQRTDPHGKPLKSTEDLELERIRAEKKKLTELRNRNVAALQNLKLHLLPPRPQCRPISQPKPTVPEYKSAQEQIRDFHHKTPARFRTVPRVVRSSLDGKPRSRTSSVSSTGSNEGTTDIQAAGSAPQKLHSRQPLTDSKRLGASKNSVNPIENLKKANLGTRGSAGTDSRLNAEKQRHERLSQSRPKGIQRESITLEARRAAILAERQKIKEEIEKKPKKP